MDIIFFLSLWPLKCQWMCQSTTLRFLALSLSLSLSRSLSRSLSLCYVTLEMCRQWVTMCQTKQDLHCILECKCTLLGCCILCALCASCALCVLCVYYVCIMQLCPQATNKQEDKIARNWVLANKRENHKSYKTFFLHIYSLFEYTSANFGYKDFILASPRQTMRNAYIGMLMPQRYSLRVSLSLWVVWNPDYIVYNIILNRLYRLYTL